MIKPPHGYERAAGAATPVNGGIPMRVIARVRFGFVGDARTFVRVRMFPFGKHAMFTGHNHPPFREYQTIEMYKSLESHST